MTNKSQKIEAVCLQYSLPVEHRYWVVPARYVRTKVIQVQHAFGLFFAPVCYYCDQELQNGIVVTRHYQK